MKIFSALGLGIFLLVLMSLMPEVFSSMSDALVAFFNSAEGAFQSLDYSSATVPASLPNITR